MHTTIDHSHHVMAHLIFKFFRSQGNAKETLTKPWAQAIPLAKDPHDASAVGRQAKPVRIASKEGLEAEAELTA